jgi:membrane-associated phospholipid phosphatase
VFDTQAGTGRRTPIQRFNHAIVNRASIQANTVPSGHAAGALATAFAVGSSMPAAGAVFLILAISIAAATVLGRYHYVIDTVLGVIVAFAAWMLVSL